MAEALGARCSRLTNAARRARRIAEVGDAVSHLLRLHVHSDRKTAGLHSGARAAEARAGVHGADIVGHHLSERGGGRRQSVPSETKLYFFFFLVRL